MLLPKYCCKSHMERKLICGLWVSSYIFCFAEYSHSMMKMTEKLQDKLYMIKLTLISIHGKMCRKKEKIFAKVKLNYIKQHIGLLEKNRHKRPTLEEVLDHPWFSDFKDIHELRKSTQTGTDNKFMAYTLTEPNSPKIKEEIEKYSQHY
jgi:hypothetical protein